MSSHTSTPPPQGTPAGRAKLHRSTDDRMVAGVAGGVARYFDIDPAAVRVGFVAASLLLAGLGGPLLYVVAWAVLPEDGKEQSIADEALATKPWQGWSGHLRTTDRP